MVNRVFFIYIILQFTGVIYINIKIGFNNKANKKSAAAAGVGFWTQLSRLCALRHRGQSQQTNTPRNYTQDRADASPKKFIGDFASVRSWFGSSERIECMQSVKRCSKNLTLFCDIRKEPREENELVDGGDELQMDKRVCVCVCT